MCAGERKKGGVMRIFSAASISACQWLEQGQVMVLAGERKGLSVGGTEVLKCVGVEKAISERNREGRLTQSNQNSLVS